MGKMPMPHRTAVNRKMHPHQPDGIRPSITNLVAQVSRSVFRSPTGHTRRGLSEAGYNAGAGRIRPNSDWTQRVGKEKVRLATLDGTANSEVPPAGQRTRALFGRLESV